MERNEKIKELINMSKTREKQITFSYVIKLKRKKSIHILTGEILICG